MGIIMAVWDYIHTFVTPTDTISSSQVATVVPANSAQVVPANSAQLNV